MEYKQIKNLKKEVTEVLMDCPDSRNSDITLTIEVWKRFYGDLINWRDSGISFIDLMSLYDLPREDNIKRVRAKLQEEARKRIVEGRTRGDEYCFFPTDPKIAKKRGLLEDEWRVAVGYPTKETAGTEKPSWRPLSEEVDKEKEKINKLF